MKNNPDYLQLVSDLRAIGIKEGDCLFVHSSFKSMGHIEGGIDTVIKALRHVLGETGTLIFPTFSFSSVTAANPVFDYVNTPSCVGAISEYARHLPDAIRSVHPTHSCVAMGMRAKEFTCDHYLDTTPVGKNSPLYKVKEVKGKILMLGCTLRSNTLMHGVEEAVPVFYVLPKEPKPYTIIMPDKTYEIPFYRHNFLYSGYVQRYDRLANVLPAEYMPKGLIHGAESILLDAEQVWKTGIETMLKDETYFVDKMEK